MDLESSPSEWRGWSDIIASNDDEDLREKYMGDAGSYPNGAVRLTYACRGWIPLAHDYGGNHFGVDLSPGDGGTPGQVINFGRDERLKFVMARSLGLFLRWMAEEMEGVVWLSTTMAAPYWSNRSTSTFLTLVAKRFGPGSRLAAP